MTPLFPIPFSLSQKRSGFSGDRVVAGRDPLTRSRRFDSEDRVVPIAGGIAQVARAMALQAIGLGFESPYLQIYHTHEAFVRLRFETEFDSDKTR